VNDLHASFTTVDASAFPGGPFPLGGFGFTATLHATGRTLQLDDHGNLAAGVRFDNDPRGEVLGSLGGGLHTPAGSDSFDDPTVSKAQGVVVLERTPVSANGHLGACRLVFTPLNLSDPIELPAIVNGQSVSRPELSDDGRHLAFVGEKDGDGCAPSRHVDPVLEVAAQPAGLAQPAAAEHHRDHRPEGGWPYARARTPGAEASVRRPRSARSLPQGQKPRPLEPESQRSPACARALSDHGTQPDTQRRGARPRTSDPDPAPRGERALTRRQAGIVRKMGADACQWPRTPVSWIPTGTLYRSANVSGVMPIRAMCSAYFAR
jgi:hypothetical protein